MSLEFTVEVWDALRTHIDNNDRRDAADSLVNLLVENNFETTEIKEAFRGDRDVLSALKYYSDQQNDQESAYDEEDDDYDDDGYED